MSRRVTRTDLLLDRGPRIEGEAFDVFLLSAPDEAQTVQLAHPIENDLVSTSGRPAAWVQNQRYARLDHLTSGATHTSQL